MTPNTMNLLSYMAVKSTVFKIWTISLHPEFFQPLKNCGVAGSALRSERGVEFELHNLQLRDFAYDKHHTVDDSPYGGGPGMVMKADVLKNALLDGVVKAGGYDDVKQLHVVYTSPRGGLWGHEKAVKLAETYWGEDATKDLVFICGRFEGVDERFLEAYVNEHICLGDFVLTGGEIAVMAILDSALRFVPGALGNKLSAQEESFSAGLLEFPQYTKPRDFEGKGVPEVLLSGHHSKIEEFKLEKQKEMTKKTRPELWQKWLKKNQ